MQITTIDKGTAEAITSRLHDAVRDVADSMGVTVYVERTKFSTVEMSVTFSIKLPADKTEFPHYVYDGFAEREGVEFDGHFVGSRYKVKIGKSSEEVTVIGVDSKARKYKVNIELADGRRYRIVSRCIEGQAGTCGGSAEGGIRYVVYVRRVRRSIGLRRGGSLGRCGGVHE